MKISIVNAERTLSYTGVNRFFSRNRRFYTCSAGKEIRDKAKFAFEICSYSCQYRHWLTNSVISNSLRTQLKGWYRVFEKKMRTYCKRENSFFNDIWEICFVHWRSSCSLPNYTILGTVFDTISNKVLPCCHFLACANTQLRKSPTLWDSDVLYILMKEQNRILNKIPLKCHFPIATDKPTLVQMMAWLPNRCHLKS